MNRMAAPNAQSPGLKTYFKTPEGRYKLLYEKTHPTGLLHYSHGKAVTQATLAHLKDKPVQQPLPSASLTTTTGARLAARFLGTGNGSRSLSFGGGNGTSKAVAGNKTGPSAHSTSATTNGPMVSNYDGEGTYLIFNVGDTLFISDFNSHDKDPIKAIHFSSSNQDGHDLLIGLNSGDVYSVSLRQQLQDPGKKLVGTQHYNKDGSLNCSDSKPNLQLTETLKTNGDARFNLSFNSNPIARWHICQGSVNSISFSVDGGFLATVGRDGYLRIFDFTKEQLICGGKSYYGALLCCAWSPDGKYVLTGGEDDLVQVWSMEDRAVVAWGEGHNSWVSGVAFDSFWTSPSSDGTGENVMYRFGSVGQAAWFQTVAPFGGELTIRLTTRLPEAVQICSHISADIKIVLYEPIQEYVPIRLLTSNIYNL